MRAELKKIHSPDVYDMEKYEPEKEFSIFVQFIIGLHGGPGEESLDSNICSSSFYKEKKDEEIYVADRRIVMRVYDYRLLKDFVSNFIESFEEQNWNDLVRHFSVLGKWEFENYKEKV